MNLPEIVVGTHCPYFTLLWLRDDFYESHLSTSRHQQFPVNIPLFALAWQSESLEANRHVKTEVNSCIRTRSTTTLTVSWSLWVSVFEEVLKMSSQSQPHTAVRQNRKSNREREKKKREREKKRESSPVNLVHLLLNLSPNRCGEWEADDCNMPKTQKAFYFSHLVYRKYNKVAAIS